VSSERRQSAQEACRRSWPHPNAASAAHGPSTPAPCSRPASPIAAPRGLQRASGSTLPAAFLRATKLRVSMLIVLILPCAIGPLAAPANLILGWRLKLGRFFCDHSLCDHLLLLLAAGAAAAQPPEAAHPRGRPVLVLQRPRPTESKSRCVCWHDLGQLIHSFKKIKNAGPKGMERTDLERWYWHRADVGRAGAAVRGRCS
jgi:hypothetical protein